MLVVSGPALMKSVVPSTGTAGGDAEEVMEAGCRLDTDVMLLLAEVVLAVENGLNEPRSVDRPAHNEWVKANEDIFLADRIKSGLTGFCLDRKSLEFQLTSLVLIGNAMKLHDAKKTSKSKTGVSDWCRHRGPINRFIYSDNIQYHTVHVFGLKSSRSRLPAK